MKALSLAALVVLLCFSALSNKIYAGVFPEEGAKLNYRIIGFSFPPMPECTSYKIEIDTGNILDPDQFNAMNTSKTSTRPRIIAEVPEFGTNYTWRIEYTLNDNKTVQSKLYHFSTMFIPLLPGNRASRLRVTQKNDSYKDHYLFVDGANVMYDMNGKVVWFFPALDGSNNSGSDIKCTPQHTITLLYGPDAYEINYAGKVLWKGPDLNFPHGQAILNTGKINVPYHHELTRLNNGHYMALGNLVPEPGEIGSTDLKDNSKSNNAATHFFPKTQEGSMLYELDSAGNLVWKWNSKDYIEHSDVGNFIADLFMKFHMPFNDTHENSFYFDQDNNTIYLSYATINRIVVISYPSGEVINSYGKTYDTLADRTTLSRLDEFPSGLSSPVTLQLFNNNMFCGQHSCRKTNDGNLILYNDNMLDTGVLSQVLIFKEPEKNEANVLTKVWEFNCPADSMNTNMSNGGGGSVYEMTNDLLFVTMNLPNTRIFIVNKNKEILWSAIPENSSSGSQWWAYSPYRSSIIDRAELEQMIWNCEPKRQKPVSSPVSHNRILFAR